MENGIWRPENVLQLCSAVAVPDYAIYFPVETNHGLKEVVFTRVRHLVARGLESKKAVEARIAPAAQSTL